jgi:kynurenine formamidase
MNFPSTKPAKTMKTLPLLMMAIAIALAGCTMQTQEQVSATDPLQLLLNATWIDLTHDFDEAAVYWPTNESFTKDTSFYGINDKGYFYASFIFSAEEHGGTHFDAPLHFNGEGKTVEQIRLDQLMGPGVVVDVSERALADRDYLVGVDDLLDWESQHGEIPDGAILLLYTGYDRFWPDPLSYTGTTLKGPEAVAALHFPGLSPEAAQWLVDNRNIDAVGLDTPSIDYGQSSDFMAHRILLGHQLTVYENLTRLNELPPSGSFIIALPMKIKGGSGAPLRIIAMTG